MGCCRTPILLLEGLVDCTRLLYIRARSESHSDEVLVGDSSLAVVVEVVVLPDDVASEKDVSKGWGLGGEAPMGSEVPEGPSR